MQIQTSCHVRKLKSGNGRLFICDTWSRYLEKLQLMHTEMRQVSNLRKSQDVYKDILSDLVRKDVYKLVTPPFMRNSNLYNTTLVWQ